MTNLYRKKAVFNWSGGKDSALALYKILQDKNYEITSLLTTVNKETQYSSMHRIPVSLLKAQAKSIGLPIYIVNLPPKQIWQKPYFILNPSVSITLSSEIFSSKTYEPIGRNN